MCCKAKTEDELNYEKDYVGDNYKYNDNNKNDFGNFFKEEVTNDKDNKSVVKAKANNYNTKNPKYLEELDYNEVNSLNNQDTSKNIKENITDNSKKPNYIINEITGAELSKNKGNSLFDNNKNNNENNNNNKIEKIKTNNIIDELKNSNSNNSKLSFSNINIGTSNNNANTNNNLGTSTFVKKQVSNKDSNGFITQLATSNEGKTRGSNSHLISVGNIKYLKLVIQESKYNQVNQVLKINNLGLEGSSRNEKDGSVYFGQKGSSFTNDFILQQEDGINSRHFEIKYEPYLNDYFIKNIKGSGVFIKISEPMALRDGMIISFGINHILVKISENDQRDNESSISFKAIYGSNKGVNL